jgi:hypothetical protein
MAPRSCQAEEGVIGPYFERLVAQRADPEVGKGSIVCSGHQLRSVVNVLTSPSPALQVGLLIGRPAVGTRDLLLGLVRTPEQVSAWDSLLQG